MLDAVDMDGVGAEWGDDLQLVSPLGPTSSDHCGDAPACRGVLHLQACLRLLKFIAAVHPW